MKTALPISVLALTAGLLATSCGQPETTSTPALSEPVPALDVELPAGIQARGHLNVGVACDSPPAGSISLTGDHVGYEIEFVKRIATFAFGDPDAVEMQCVNGDNRVPFLESGKIDMILATFAWTEERAVVIDYSDPIWVSNLRMVVPKDSDIDDYDDLSGKTVIIPTGSAYVRWFETCHPEARLSLVSSVVDGTTALQQGRGDAFAYIDIYDYNFASINPDYQVVGSFAAPSDQGIGIKKGNAELLNWTNAVIEQMRQDDFFYEAFASAVADENFIADYRDVVPGPDIVTEYSDGGENYCTPAS